MTTSEVKQFSAEMTIADALAVHPDVAGVFAAHCLQGCPHCHVAQVETIEQVCAGHGFSLDALLAELNALLTTSPPE